MEILILFDIDGTILQMKQGVSKDIFSKFLIELFGKDIQDKHIPGFHGMTDLQIIKEIALNINYPFHQIEANLMEIWQKLSDDFVKYCTKDNIDLLPGAVELIELLHNDSRVKLGLLTGNIKRNAYAKLDVYDLGRYFPVGAFGDDSFDRNELPEIAFKRANSYYENSNFSGENSMLTGDSPRDIECGKINSIPVLAVASGWSDKEELAKHNPEYLFDDFSDYKEVYHTIINHFDNEENHNSN
jgi:phosphoglycolate phosphatase-like HAD superfamily hydrolase